jgi:prevent-host-death family protein
MSVVSVSELKNRLSHYLRLVAAGEPVFVRSRDRIVARLEPVREGEASMGDDAAWLQELERRGTLRPAARPITADWLERRPRVEADLVQAILDERAAGR